MRIREEYVYGLGAGSQYREDGETRVRRPELPYRSALDSVSPFSGSPFLENEGFRVSFTSSVVSIDLTCHDSYL